MITPVQDNLLSTLGELSAAHPSMRFGQLLANIASMVDMTTDAVWTVEDGALLGEAREHLASQVERLGPPGPETAGGDATRLALLREIHDFLDRNGHDRFGEAVALLVRAGSAPRSVEEWAGAIWDVEDEDLLQTIRRDGDPGSDAARASWTSEATA